ncbi:MAG: nucleoside hydrolase [Chloroflexi bacterium]|nr:nucleoside hydrolase [Chloroflexota bacterium]
MHRLLIDTDPGVDDSMMLQWAFKRPDVDVVAITAVFGNGGSAITGRNALKNLEIAGRSGVPVACGADKPLMRVRSNRGSTVHGDDGLGNSNLPFPSGKPASLPAAQMIVETINRYPGEIELLAVGPLTNVATAVLLDASIAQKVKQVVIMGGAATVRGNASPVAEANIRNDPEAARIVFNAGWPFTMIGLDVTMQSMMSSEYLERIYAAQTPTTDFIKAIVPFYYAGYFKRMGISQMPVHDSSALAYILDPSLFTCEKVYVHVETQSERTFGQTSPDFRGQWEQAPNVNLALGVDSRRFLETYAAEIVR